MDIIVIFEMTNKNSHLYNYINLFLLFLKLLICKYIIRKIFYVNHFKKNNIIIIL